MRPDARSRETHAVVEQGDEGREEGGRPRGGGEGAAEPLGILGPPGEEVQGEIRGHGPLEGAQEARQGVVLAGRPAAHVHHLAREGDRGGRVAPFQRPPVVCAHGLQQRGVAGVLAVAERALAAPAQRLDQTGVDGGRRADPPGVGARQGRRRVEPRPHDQRARDGEDGRVGHSRCERIQLCGLDIGGLRLQLSVLE